MTDRREHEARTVGCVRSWQWLAIPGGLALIALVSAFPFTRYTDPENSHVTDRVETPESVKVRMEHSHGYGFLSTSRIRELNQHPVQLSSGGNAEPNWLVVILLGASAALLSGFVLGYRVPSVLKRREALSNAILGFVVLTASGLGYSMLAASGFSWKLAILSPIASLGGLVLIGKSTTQGRTARSPDGGIETDDD